MALGCGAKVLKYCLFAFNLVFFFAGVACLGIGIWLIVAKDEAVGDLVAATEKLSVGSPEHQKDLDTLRAHPDAIGVLGIIFIVGGSIVFLIAFLGCCGAVKEWRPLLVLYAVCLMIILAIEVAAAIYAGVNKSGLETELKTAMQKSLSRFYNGTDGDPGNFKAAWDAFANSMECCGVENVKGEFNETGWFQTRNEGKSGDDIEFFPAACCPPKPDGKYEESCNSDSPGKFDQGCYTKFRDFVESKLTIVLGVGIAVAALQIFGIIFAFCLCSAIGEEEYA